MSIADPTNAAYLEAWDWCFADIDLAKDDRATLSAKRDVMCEANADLRADRFEMCQAGYPDRNVLYDSEQRTHAITAALKLVVARIAELPKPFLAESFSGCIWAACQELLPPEMVLQIRYRANQLAQERDASLKPKETPC